jgi:glycosyltransferase involved in cell wall biosynthesis
MRILIITQYFAPEMGAAQARLFELSTRLCNNGHRVEILTAMPNYPTGKVFDGYQGRWVMQEEMSGLKVLRSWIYPSKSQKVIPRLLNYFSFVFSSLFVGCLHLKKQDVVLFESPPLFIVPVGILLGRLSRARVIMNVSDIWPDIIVRMGYPISRMFLKLMIWLEEFGYKHADVVALTNPEAAEQINQRFPEVTTTVISNGVDCDFFKPELRNEDIRSSFGVEPDEFMVAYCGLHGMAQGLEVVIGAAKLLLPRKNIKFIMIGDGPTKEQLMEMAEKAQLNNLQFHDSKPKAEIPAILASSDISLVPLSTRLPGTMPSKFYEALASGAPVITAKGCVAEGLVDKYKVGRNYEPLNAQEMVDAILDITQSREHWNENRQLCIELSKRFSRDFIAEQTESILQAVTDGRELPRVSW